MAVHDVDVDAIGPGRSASATCSPRRAKSADKIEGANLTCLLLMNPLAPKKKTSHASAAAQAAHWRADSNTLIHSSKRPAIWATAASRVVFLCCKFTIGSRKLDRPTANPMKPGTLAAVLNHWMTFSRPRPGPARCSRPDRARPAEPPRPRPRSRDAGRGLRSSRCRARRSQTTCFASLTISPLLLLRSSRFCLRHPSFIYLSKESEAIPQQSWNLSIQI